MYVCLRFLMLLKCVTLDSSAVNCYLDESWMFNTLEPQLDCIFIEFHTFSEFCQRQIYSCVVILLSAVSG